MPALDEGDQLTVRDALYAMMLRSANEAANGWQNTAPGRSNSLPP